MSPIVAVIADAVITPTPGIVCSRRLPSLARWFFRMAFSIVVREVDLFRTDGFIAAVSEPCPLLGCAAGQSLRSRHGRHYEFGASSNAGWPAARDRFQPGIEANAFRTMHVVVAKDRRFPSAEGMECHRHRDRNVDSDHADPDLVREFPGRIAVAGEDRCAVAEFVLVDHPCGGVVVGSTDDRQNGPKNL